MIEATIAKLANAELANDAETSAKEKQAKLPPIFS